NNDEEVTFYPTFSLTSSASSNDTQQDGAHCLASHRLDSETPHSQLSVDNHLSTTS
ncbi:unnamed protein product, partial [Amoebophrya sp. A25]